MTRHGVTVSPSLLARVMFPMVADGSYKLAFEGGPRRWGLILGGGGQQQAWVFMASEAYSPPLILSPHYPYSLSLLSFSLPTLSL